MNDELINPSFKNYSMDELMLMMRLCLLCEPESVGWSVFMQKLAHEIIARKYHAND